jgi:ATP-binding cassette subfamily F protein 3
MDKLNTSLSALEEKLADNELYTDANKDKLKDLLQQQAGLKADLQQAETDWFEASEALEEAQAE